MTRKSYYTHDNGGRPFRVDVFKERAGEFLPVLISVQIFSIDEANEEEEVYSRHVKTYDNVEKVFVGKHRDISLPTKYFDGNSLLLKLHGEDKRYVWIGENIYEFSTPEPITKYNSYVGNNDVPYPVAFSKNYVYFLLAPPKQYDLSYTYSGGELASKKIFPEGTKWENDRGQMYEIYYDLFKNLYKPKEREEVGLHQFSNYNLIQKRIF
jgi:hypothetical protein